MLYFIRVNDEQFNRGIGEFNRGAFFECHDTLEDLWHGTRGVDRLFLQGLIQISVGFYHLGRRNYRGAASQFTLGLGKLANYRPSHRGLNIRDLTKEVVPWLEVADRAMMTGTCDVDESKFPKIKVIQNTIEGE